MLYYNSKSVPSYVFMQRCFKEIYTPKAWSVTIVIVPFFAIYYSAKIILFILIKK